MTVFIPPAFVTALRTLTAIPVPGSETGNPADALPWFPVTGALIGFALWTVAGLTRLIMPAIPDGLLAGVIVTSGVLLTRGLHFDGLADWADALWGGWTREHRLEIMKDSSLGTFGTLALILVVLAKWSALSTLATHNGLAWLLIAGIVSRTVQVNLAACFHYARLEGGTGAVFIRQATRRHHRQALSIALVSIWVLGGLAWRPLVFTALTLALGHAFGHSARKSIGGVTGDILGAASELSETLVLILAASRTPF